MRKYDYKNLSMEIGDPVVVLQGGTWDECGWGPYQFPTLSRTRNGFIRYTCNGPAARDDIDGYEGEALPFGRISEDGGDTWRELTQADEPCGAPLPDGKEYIRPKNKNAFTAPWLEKYTPDAPAEGLTPYGGEMPDMYYADKIPEYPKNPEAYLYDTKTGVTESFPMTIHWPYLSVQAFRRKTGTLVYPMEMLMGMMGHVMADPDGTLFFATYTRGFSGVTGKPAWLYLVDVLRSDDGGRTWDWQSEVLTTPEYDPHLPGFEGFCEPYIERMTDGSVIMLMRTGSGCPSYIVRSTDNCKTWSKPEKFDEIGVLPQLLRLACGVTLSTYGRPGVFLRATDDEKGLLWEEPVSFDVSGNGYDSCCYTSLLALDDTTALAAYSHFRYPDKNGVPVKTLLVRKIRVFPQ